jgi:hypothetical protein
MALDFRLRKASGEAFQQFFNDFMGRVHGDEFVPVRPHGNLGDDGVDGMFGLGGTVYQCYGARNGAVSDVGRVCGKIERDYATAKDSNPGMRSWNFVHNLVDGIPKPITDTLAALQLSGASDGVRVGHFGFHTFKQLMGKLEEAELEELLGLRAMSEVDRTALPADINQLVAAVMSAIDNGPMLEQEAKPVPQDKLDFNGIPAHWRMHIKAFFVHAPIAEKCLATFGREEAAQAVPAYMRQQYVALRSQGLQPGQVLHELRTLLAGFVTRAADSSLDAAVLTILASMFESCVIFEDKPGIDYVEPSDDPA